MRHKLRFVAFIAVIWFASTAQRCWTPIASNPPQGETSLSVPHYYQPNNYFCGPASILMWRAYRLGSPQGKTQQDIWNWMTERYPYDVVEYSGASSWAISAAASEFVGEYITDDSYYGMEEIRHAVADQKRGLEWGRPTIAIMYQGAHAVVVVGTSWHLLSTAQPQSDFMIYHDPLRAPRTYATLSNWLNYDFRSCGGECAMNIQVSTQKNSGILALEEFDYWGGTYYGDPNPPICEVCEIGVRLGSPDSPPVLARLPWRRLFGRLNRLRSSTLPSSRMSRTVGGDVQGWRPTGADNDEKFVAPQHETSLVARRGEGAPPMASVPHPFATATDRILENIAAGVQQAWLDHVPGMEPLALKDGSLRVRRLLSVESLSGNPDYYLVELEDQVGRPFANVTISKEGWLLSVEDVRGLSLPRTIDEATAALRLRATLGRVARGFRYVHAPGNVEPGASAFAPLAEFEIDAVKVYLNTRAEVFAETSGPVDASLVVRGVKKGLTRLSR